MATSLGFDGLDDLQEHSTGDKGGSESGESGSKSVPVSTCSNLDLDRFGDRTLRLGEVYYGVPYESHMEKIDRFKGRNFKLCPLCDQDPKTIWCPNDEAVMHLDHHHYSAQHLRADLNTHVNRIRVKGGLEYHHKCLNVALYTYGQVTVHERVMKNVPPIPYVLTLDNILRVGGELDIPNRQIKEFLKNYARIPASVVDGNIVERISAKYTDQIDSIRRAYESLETSAYSAAEMTLDTVSTIDETVKQTSGIFDKISSTVIEHVASLKSMNMSDIMASVLSKIESHGINIVKVGSILTAMYFGRRIKMVVMSCLVNLFLEMNLQKYLYQWIADNFISRITDVLFKGSEDVDDATLTNPAWITPKLMLTLGSVTLLACGATLMGGTERKDNESLWDFASRRAQNLGQLRTGKEALKEWITWMNNSIEEMYYTFIAGGEERACEKSKKDLEFLKSEAKWFVEEGNDSKVRSKVGQKRLFIFLDKARQYKVKYLINSASADLARQVNLLVQTVSVACAHKVFERRVTPWVPVACGETGGGKSTNLNSFVEMCLLSQDIKPVTYNKGPTTYWDGLTSEVSAVTFDDAWSKVNDTDEIMEFLQIVSNCTLPVNMASLEDKGMVMLADIVAVTTNTPYPAIVMNNPDAFRRRRHFMMKFRPIEGVEKDPKNPAAHLKFDILDGAAAKETVVTRDLSWSEVVALGIAEFSKHRERELALAIRNGVDPSTLEPLVKYTPQEAAVKAGLLIKAQREKFESQWETFMRGPAQLTAPTELAECSLCPLYGFQGVAFKKTPVSCICDHRFHLTCLSGYVADERDFCPVCQAPLSDLKIGESTCMSLNQFAKDYNWEGPYLQGQKQEHDVIDLPLEPTAFTNNERIMTNSRWADVKSKVHDKMVSFSLFVETSRTGAHTWIKVHMVDNTCVFIHESVSEMKLMLRLFYQRFVESGYKLVGKKVEKGKDIIEESQARAFVKVNKIENFISVILSACRAGVVFPLYCAHERFTWPLVEDCEFIRNGFQDIDAALDGYTRSVNSAINRFCRETHQTNTLRMFEALVSIQKVMTFGPGMIITWICDKLKLGNVWKWLTQTPAMKSIVKGACVFISIVSAGLVVWNYTNLFKESPERAVDHFVASTLNKPVTRKYETVPRDGRIYTFLATCERCNDYYTVHDRYYTEEYHQKFAVICPRCQVSGKNIILTCADTIPPVELTDNTLTGNPYNPDMTLSKTKRLPTAFYQSLKIKHPSTMKNITNNVLTGIELGEKVKGICVYEPDVAILQAVKAEEINESIINKIKENIVSLVYSDGSVINGLGVKGRTFITFAHSLQTVLKRDGVARFTAKYHDGENIIDIKPSNVTEWKDGESRMDIVQVTIDHGYCFNDISKHFADEMALSQLVGSDVVVLRRDYTGKYSEIVRTHSNITKVEMDLKFVGDTDGERLYNSINVAPYKSHASACGAVGLVLRGKEPPKIALMQVGAANQFMSGKFLFLSKERVRQFQQPELAPNKPDQACLTNFVELNPDGTFVVPEVSDCGLPSNRIIVAKTKPEFRVNAFEKSQIQPSFLQEYLISDFVKPSFRVKEELIKDGRNHITAALDKKKENVGPWDPQIIRRIRDHKANTYINKLRVLKAKGFPLRKLTRHEAINGILPYIEAMKFKTSAGFPFNGWKPKVKALGGKLDFLEEVGYGPTGAIEYDLKQPYLDMFLEYQRVVKDEKYDPYSFFSLKLKDAKVSATKPGKLRVFNMCNLFKGIHERMYGGALRAAKNFLNVDVNSITSIDCTREGGSKVGNYINTKLNKVLFDYEKYDTIVAFDMYTYGVCEMDGDICDALYDEYTSEDRAIHMCLAYSDLMRFEIRGTTVTYESSAMPSGGNKTYEGNCDYNDFMVNHCLIDQQQAILHRMSSDWQEQPPLTASHFAFAKMSLNELDEQLLRLFCGDDADLSCDDWFLDVFNGLIYQEYLAEKGVTITSPTKGSDLKAWYPIAEGDVVKRRYEAVIPGVWKMKLDPKTIWDMMLWYKSSRPLSINEQTELLQQTFANATREAALHGREFFDNYTSCMIGLGMEFGQFFTIEKSFNEEMAEFYEAHGLPNLE